jgi:hypothetical protein
MGRTVDIGSRIELVPMDPHFHDISLALYRQERESGPEFLVHTYSGLEGASLRVESVRQAMIALGGMESTPDGLLCFPCGAAHELACKRLFLEACKLDPSQPYTARPLRVFDKKADCDIAVSSLGDGVYRVGAASTGKNVERRVSAIAGGLIKLGQMEDQAEDQVAFSCGQGHDPLVGLILVRAPNVRAVMREQEQSASRGVLSAPSQQE